MRFMALDDEASTLAWAYLTPSESFLYDDQYRLRVSLKGRSIVLLDEHQLEHTRVQRHMYKVEWEDTTSGNQLATLTEFPGDAKMLILTSGGSEVHGVATAPDSSLSRG